MIQYLSWLNYSGQLFLVIYWVPISTTKIISPKITTTKITSPNSLPLNS